MRSLSGILAVVVLVAGCSSSGSKSATMRSTNPPSSSPHSSVSFGSNGSRDDTFIATLGQSPYANDYAAKTREDLIKYANDFCRQATAPPSPGLQEILAMTPDPSA